MKAYASYRNDFGASNSTFKETKIYIGRWKLDLHAKAQQECRQVLKQTGPNLYRIPDKALFWLGTHFIFLRHLWKDILHAIPVKQRIMKADFVTMN